MDGRPTMVRATLSSQSDAGPLNVSEKDFQQAKGSFERVIERAPLQTHIKKQNEQRTNTPVDDKRRPADEEAPAAPPKRTDAQAAKDEVRSRPQSTPDVQQLGPAVSMSDAESLTKTLTTLQLLKATPIARAAKPAEAAAPKEKKENPAAPDAAAGATPAPVAPAKPQPQTPNSVQAPGSTPETPPVAKPALATSQEEVASSLSMPIVKPSYRSFSHPTEKQPYQASSTVQSTSKSNGEVR